MRQGGSGRCPRFPAKLGTNRRFPWARIVRQESKLDQVSREIRETAVAVFDQQEPDVPVLDLVADSLIDAVPGTSGRVRRLRFAGHDGIADVDVHGTKSLTLDVRLSPHEPAVIEVRTADASGRVATRCRGRGLFRDVSPGVTSVLVWSADAERKVARTAWVRL